mgnify:CR=1 FL=1
MNWIKMRSNLWDDPRIARLCDLTGKKEAEVIGGLYWLWTMADVQTENGMLEGLSTATIDRKTGFCLGCKRTIPEIGRWASIEDVERQAISIAPLLYIQGGSVHDQQGFTPGEVADIKRYVLHGGSLLCAGLAWPWVEKAYGNKPVGAFPLNKIGKELGFEITGENVGKPVARDAGIFGGLSESQLKAGDWWPSKVVSLAPGSEVVSEDPEGRSIVVAYSLGRGRVMVFGNPGMLDEDEEILRRSVRYLLPKSKIQPK